MLTLDLVHTIVKSNRIVPKYINPEDPQLLAIANTLIHIYQDHQNKPRGMLEDALETIFEKSPDVLIYRGLAKLLEDRCLFELSCQKEPSLIRQVVFQIASKFHQKRQFQRILILQEASKQLGIQEHELTQIIYADLRQHHILQNFETILPENLLRRYNTALVQALLFRAQSLQISIFETNHARYRQIFRAIKFYRLLYQITRIPQQGFQIILDGPMSLFSACQKYGIQMAMFLPVLLLSECWKLKAHIHWKRPKEVYLELNSNERLYSHYPDHGLYQPPELIQFKGRFQAIDTSWEIKDDCYLLEIGSQICIPDYTFIHQSQKCTVYLEVFGFWHKASLQKRSDDLKKSPYHILIAVPKKWSAEAKIEEISDPHIYFFREILNPKEILQRLQEYFLVQSGVAFTSNDRFF